MADRGGNKKWSEEEKIHYLMKIIESFIANGSKITGLQNISIPNRTVKACTSYWDKVRHHHADYLNADSTTATAAASGSEQPSTPAANPKKGGAAPGNRKRTAKIATIVEGDDGDVLPTPSVKRQRKAPAAKSKATATQVAAATQTIDDDETEVDDGEI